MTDRNLVDDLTIIVSASPSPTHPSAHLIFETLGSLKFLELPKGINIILAHDGIKHHSPELLNNYDQYLKELKNSLYDQEVVKLLVNKKWTHLNGVLHEAIDQTFTKYVLVLQHDLPFIRHIDLAKLIEFMETNSEIKHVRFSKSQEPYFWDIDPRYRKKYYLEHHFAKDGLELVLTKTLGWTDNNYLCTKEYFEKVVFPITRSEKIFPESAMNLASSRFTKNLFGNWRYGGIDDGPYIEHTNGRGESEPSNIESPFKRNWKLNITRAHVFVKRIQYRLRAAYLVFKSGKGSAIE
jgi:hypothetical protein